jgi:hypothetical protein
VHSSTNGGGASVTIAIFNVGEKSTLIREDFADGHSEITWVKDADVTAQLVAGLKARGGKIGFDASAAVSAGARLEGARVYDFDNQHDADEFQQQVREAGSFKQVARDVVEGPDPFGIDDWILDHTIGRDVDPGDLPDPDSTYVSPQALLHGDAQVSGGLAIADAGAKALAEAASGARVFTSGKDAGKVELYIKLSAEAAAHLGVLTLGPDIGGKAEFTATVTLDPHHGYRPTELAIDGSAGYDGRGLGEVGLRPTEGQLDALQEAIHKSLWVKEAALGNQGGAGQKAELEADLPLDDPESEAKALALLTGDPGAAADIARRMDSDGELTFQIYDTTSSETEGGVEVGLGVGVGVEGSQGSESESLHSALVRDPGSGWRSRDCGPIPS